jgi:tripartite-type tricarboxylate transporter receptor subunit TctC
MASLVTRSSTKEFFMKRVSLTAVAAALSFAAFSAAAEYPEKPITVVVPFAAGGPTDRVARDLAEAMRKPLGGVSIVVENVGGGGSAIGSNKVAKAEADG